ncbi:MAG: protein-glutamate O-methyltransferase CheR [Bacteroidota bacterium]|nr:protein-glutamate O-methyltransferase CheR [Candidatus Kapabacteria bacterium]MDW8219409.1 protein-glutamate O-methyltransferase CheR [Bacteroidota bacterium]
MASDLFEKFRFSQSLNNPDHRSEDTENEESSGSNILDVSKYNVSQNAMFSPASEEKSQLGQITIPPILLSADNANAPKMDEQTFKKFRDFIYEQCGISFTENKKYLLEGRIAKRLEAHNLSTFEEYFELLSNSASAREELPSLFEVVTINETYFFRNPPQFEALEQVILPEIIATKQAQASKKVRIWSAASSSGEEAYTISMLILERIKPQFPGFTFEIIGSDINTTVLEKARSGVFKEYSVRNMPEYYLNKYFTRDGDKYILLPEVQSQVKFMWINLYDTPTMRTMIGFDVIFCCNVLIYFDTVAKQQVVADLYDALNKGGYLFIGYSESLHGVSKAFKLVHFPKTIAYKKE